MKIALVSSFVPFVPGGARNIVEWLEIMLKREGHQVEIVYLPEVDSPDTLFQQMVAFRWVDLSAADRVICFRPQAHLVQHQHKILWFIHHIRAFYDFWGSERYRPFPDDERHREFRAALFDIDTAAIKEAKHVFTNSAVVAERLKHFNGIDSEILYPPVLEPERFTCRQYNDEILCISRVEHHKRQHLLIEAMAYTKTDVRLRICGSSGDPGYVKQLSERISDLRIQHRVTLDCRWISEQEKIDLLAECLAVAYLPDDEDSYGYPSIEGSHSSKAILTTSDSGGVLELVIDGFNGYVTDSKPEALARAIDSLYRDKTLAQTLGVNAQSHLFDMKISWPHVIERLLA